MYQETTCHPNLILDQNLMGRTKANLALPPGRAAPQHQSAGVPRPPRHPGPACAAQTALSRQMPKDYSPSLPDHARHPEEPKVRDDHFAIVVEDIFGLEIFVHDTLGVQIPHALEDSTPYVRGRGGEY